MNVTRLPRFRVTADLDAKGRTVWFVWDATAKLRYATKSGTLGAAISLSRKLNGLTRLAAVVLGDPLDDRGA